MQHEPLAPVVALSQPLEEDDGENWHVAHARALETDVRLLESCLIRLDVVGERFAADGKFAGELRSIAARLRTKRNELADEARTLRQQAPRPRRKKS